MKIMTAALAVALVATSAMTLVPATPADAQALESLRNRQRQRQAQQEQAQPQQPQVGELSREENPAIQPLHAAVTASDWTAAAAALPAAQAGARTPYGRYVVGQLQLALARGTNNVEMQHQAVDAMVASGGAPADLMPQLLGIQADRAIGARNYAAAEPIINRLIELAPNDPAQVERLAQVKSQLNKHDEALALYRRAATMRTQAGQQVPEDSYRRMLATAYQLRQAQPSMELARDLLTHYPGTASNWRDSLTIYRELSNLDAPAQLDVYRLIRVAGALNGEADYINYAEAAERGAMFGEVKAVLEAGLGRNQIQPGNTGYARQMLTSAEGRIAEDRASLANERSRALAGANGTAALRLGDAYYGYGQFAEAAELYRAALQKGGVDANLVNTRLGAALAQAGQRAEAEAAFNAVQGPRQPLAQFWLMWLARQG
jgi:tetratricopeptide (TPR) repeat protein